MKTTTVGKRVQIKRDRGIDYVTEPVHKGDTIVFHKDNGYYRTREYQIIQVKETRACGIHSQRAIWDLEGNGWNVEVRAPADSEPDTRQYQIIPAWALREGMRVWVTQEDQQRLVMLTMVRPYQTQEVIMLGWDSSIAGIPEDSTVQIALNRPLSEIERGNFISFVRIAAGSYTVETAKVTQVHQEPHRFTVEYVDGTIATVHAPQVVSIQK